MAASYYSGVASSPTDLLTTLEGWLYSQAWTIEDSASDGSGWRSHLSKGGQYVHMRSAMDERIWPNAAAGNWDGDPDGGYGIGLYLGTGYSGAAAWDAQAGGPLRSDGSRAGAGMNLPSDGGAAYYFFDDGNNNITVVVERTPGIFCHMGWGPSLTGPTTDFWYFHGSSSVYRNVWNDALTGDLPGFNLSAWPPFSHGPKEPVYGGALYAHACNFVRVDSGTYSARWVTDPGQDSATYGGTGRLLRCSLNLVGSGMQDGEYPCYRYLIGRTKQTAFVGSIILPLKAFVLTDPGARWAPLGKLPTVWWSEAVGNGFGAGDVVAIGGVNYKLFPNFAVLKAA